MSTFDQRVTTLTWGARTLQVSLLLGLALGALSAANVTATAEQVGTAVVDGRVVVLDSDGTWKYADLDTSGSSGCRTVENVEFCMDSLPGWKASKNDASDFVASYDNNSKGYYFGFISEPAGSDAGMTYEGLRTAILENAASASGIDPSAVPVLATEESVSSLLSMRSITYLVDFKGTPAVFYNCYQIMPSRAIQFAFWTIGKKVTPEFAGETQKFLSKVKLK